MGRVFTIIQPLLLAALVLGTARMLLSTGGFHDWAPLFSLTGLQIVACLYLPYRVIREEGLGLGHLWICLSLLFLFSQTLYTGATGFAFALGRLQASSLGLEGEAGLGDFASHLVFHFKLWVLLLPTLATGVLGGPLLYLSRRRGPGAAASNKSALGPFNPS